MANQNVQTGTADFATATNALDSFTLTAGADAAVVNLREGSVTGAIKFVVKAAIQATTHLSFPHGARTSDGSVWFVDLVSGTTPQMTTVGGSL
jgi:hypothetical protein